MNSIKNIIERLVKGLARIDNRHGIIKRAFLNPATHLFYLECANRVSIASTILMHSLKRVIIFISSENGGMINPVVAFSALPGGYRNNSGNYNNMGNNGYFWSSTENNSNNAWNRKLNYNNSNVNHNNNNKRYGFSIRCVRDIKDSLPASLKFNQDLWLTRCS